MLNWTSTTGLKDKKGLETSGNDFHINYHKHSQTKFEKHETPSLNVCLSDKVVFCPRPWRPKAALASTVSVNSKRLRFLVLFHCDFTVKHFRWGLTWAWISMSHWCASHPKHPLDLHPPNHLFFMHDFRGILFCAVRCSHLSFQHCWTVM